MIIRDNFGKPIGFIEALTSNKEVVTVNQSGNATTVTTRDRSTGRVKTETFFGTLPLLRKD